MATATISGVQLAHTDKPIPVEGNQYFPPSALEMKYFKPSSAGTSTTCGWKGKASYYDVHLDDGKVIKDAAWYYPSVTTARAKNIEGYVAFYQRNGLSVK